MNLRKITHTQSFFVQIYLMLFDFAFLITLSTWVDSFSFFSSFFFTIHYNNEKTNPSTWIQNLLNCINWKKKYYLLSKMQKCIHYNGLPFIITINIKLIIEKGAKWWVQRGGLLWLFCYLYVNRNMRNNVKEKKASIDSYLTN
jgi:hypothetical protein